MFGPGIAYLLQTNGYQILGSNVPYIALYYKETDDKNTETCINIIGIVDNVTKVNINNEQLNNISFQIERKFLLAKSQNVNMLFVVLTNDVERDKILNESEAKFWLIDTNKEQLFIFENQPEDFDNIRAKLENNISNTQIENHRRPSKKSFPFVTLVLIAINIIVFILLEINGSTENIEYMLNHGAAFHKYIFEKHEYYRLITCVFMHFGISHLLNNMVALWILGIEAERYYGRLKYSVIYIASGICGSLASSLYYMYTNQGVVSAGASGAIYGLLGSLLVKIIEERKLYGKSSYSRVFLVFLLLLYSGNREQNIDNVAHVVGALAGIIIGFICYCFGKQRNNIENQNKMY